MAQPERSRSRADWRADRRLRRAGLGL